MMEFDLDFDADDVWIIVAIMRHTVHNVQDTHFDIRHRAQGSASLELSSSPATVRGPRRWSLSGYGHLRGL